MNKKKGGIKQGSWYSAYKRSVVFLSFCAIMAVFWRIPIQTEASETAGWYKVWQEAVSAGDSRGETVGLAGSPSFSDQDSKEAKREIVPAAGYRPLDWQEPVDPVGSQREEYPLCTSLEDTSYNPLEQEGGFLPPVRNQSPYGTCWAFASLGMGEIAAGKSGKSLDLSELHLAFFSYHTANDPMGGLEGDQNRCLGGNFLDVGGNMFFSRVLLANWTGAASEEMIPYGQAGQVLGQGLPEKLAYQDVLHLQGAWMVDIKKDRALVKDYIRGFGSVGTGYGDYGQQEYYRKDTHAYYCEDDLPANHAILIVGWDDAFPAENFAERPAEDGAWLVRNSWGGSGYGRYSYFWLSYEDQTLEDTAYVFVYEDADNYDHNYQYDGAMMTRDVVMPSGQQAANVFIPNVHNGRGEVLRSVGFYCGSSNTEYRIEVYTDLQDMDHPESGKYEHTAAVTGTVTAEGYYTVALGEEIPLEKGHPFSIVVTLSKNGGTARIGAEGSARGSWYEIIANAAPGQSFWKVNGEWTDYGKEKQGNLRIKAFTSDVDEVLLARIQLQPEQVTLERGKTAALQAAFYPEGAEPGELKWSSQNEDVARVDGSGLVTGMDFGSTWIQVESRGRSSHCKIEVPFPLTDVSVLRGNWRYEGIRHVYLEQIMGAVTGTSCFYPDRILTRGMLAVILYRLAGEPVVNQDPWFTDTETGRWYSCGIAWVADQGIAHGYGDGSFGVDDPVTREQAAKMISIWMQMEGMGVYPENVLLQFSDCGEISPWAAGHVAALTEIGVLTGKPDGKGNRRIEPKAGTTRAECAAMIQRLHGWQQREAGRGLGKRYSYSLSEGIVIDDRGDHPSLSEGITIDNRKQNTEKEEL